MLPSIYGRLYVPLSSRSHRHGTTTEYQTRIHISSDIRSVNPTAPRNNSNPPPLPQPALQPHLEENSRSPSAQITPQGQGRGDAQWTHLQPGGGRTLSRPSPSSSSRRRATAKTNTQESLCRHGQHGEAGSPDGPAVGEIRVFNRPSSSLGRNSFVQRTKQRSHGPAAVNGRRRDDVETKKRSAERMGRKTADAVLIGAARGRDGLVACLVRREGNQNAPALSPISPASSEPPPLFLQCCMSRWEWEWEWHQPLPRRRPFIAFQSSFFVSPKIHSTNILLYFSCIRHVPDGLETNHLD
jgi:hypothetical protein